MPSTVSDQRAEPAAAAEPASACGGGRRAAGPGRRLPHRLAHHLAHRDAGAEADAGAGETARVGRRGADRLGRLHLGVLLHPVAEDAQLRALVDRLLDLLGQRDVLDEEARQLEAEAGELGRENAPAGDRELVVVRREVERRDLRLGEGVGEPRQDRRAQLAGDLVGRGQAAGADDVLEEDLGVRDPHGIGAEGPQPDHAELGVAHHHRVGGAPLEVGEQPGVEEVDLGLERALETVLPAAQGGQDRHVLGLDLVAPGREEVGRLALVDEERDLVLAHDELGAHLDLLVVDRKAPDQRVGRIVEPLDDLDELRPELLLDVVHQTHGRSSCRRREAQRSAGSSSRLAYRPRRRTRRREP